MKGGDDGNLFCARLCYNRRDFVVLLPPRSDRCCCRLYHFYLPCRGLNQMQLTIQKYLNINHPWWGSELERKSPYPTEAGIRLLRFSSPEPVRRDKRMNTPRRLIFSLDYKTVAFQSPARSRICPTLPLCRSHSRGPNSLSAVVKAPTG